MNRLSLILSPLFLLGLFKMAFGWVLPPSWFDAAPRLGYNQAALPEQASLRSKLIRWVLDNYGVVRITDDQMLHLTIAVLVYSAVFGVLSHAVFKGRGFGPSLNGIVCFAGACCGLVGCVRSGMAFTADQYSLVIIIVILASTTLLLAMAVIKTWVLNACDDFMSGGTKIAKRSSKHGPTVAEQRLSAIGGKGRL